MHGFSFVPRFADVTMASGIAGDLVAFERVRVRLVTTDGRVAIDRVVDFPSAATEVPVEFTVQLSSSASAEGELMDLSLAFINAQGDTVFRGGPAPVLVVPNRSGSQPPPPVELPVVYSGVGANATQVVITSPLDTVVAGSTFSYTAEARDAQGAAIANTPIAWRVITPGKATLPSAASGAGTTLATRGEALIVAQLLTGQSDTMPLEILPLAQSLTLVSGNNQTAVLGALLAQPLVVRVDATDGQPMAGVAVAFAVTAGGGSISQLTDTTDASGIASVQWTTGTSLAAQTATATVAGLTGSPVTFTAVPPALSLVFDVNPTSVAIGAPITPAVQLSVRDGQGNVATAFTGNVTIALGAGSPAGTLGGTLTVAAVAGVATFADLSLNLVGSPYSLVATAPSLSLTSAPSSAFTVVAGTPTQLAFVQSPSSATAGEIITPAITVEARDANGNVVTTFTDPVTLQFQQGTGSLLGTLTMNAVAGVATFSDIAITGEDLATQLRATATGLTAAVSPTFAVANGPAAKVRFSPANLPPPVLAGQVISPVTVRAYDAFDNFVNDFTGPVTVAIGTNPSGGVLGGTLTVNAVGGVATFSDLTVSLPGVGYTLVASSSGLTDHISDAFTVEPFAFANAWINASGGNWSNPANWSLGRTPEASDTVVISLAGTYTVSMDVSDTVAVVIIGGETGAQTLALGTRQLRVDSSAVVLATGVLDLPSSGTITGAGVVENLGLVSMSGGTHAFTLDNAGQLRLQGAPVFNGALVTQESSVIESLASGGTTQATITNGFTNNGLIELRTLNAFWGNSLTVGGTLVNASGGIIRAVPGFGSKTLAAQLDNQGTVDVTETLTLAGVSAQHVNSGTIVTSGGGSLSVSQTGTSPSFTNVGTITLGPGGFFVTGGALTLTGGTLTGEGSVLWTNGVTLTVDVASARAPWELNNTVVTGTVTVPAGDSLRFNTGSPTMTLVNEGRVILQSNPILNGTLTTAVGSVLEVRAAVGSTQATITNGFTNNGLIELRTSNAFWGNQLTVGGTLVNAPDGIIRSIAGFGSKTLSAEVENQGAIEVLEALTIAGVSAQHINTGNILVSGANLSITQSGTTPSFTNGGAITIATGRGLFVTGGALILTGGTLTGEGGVLWTNGVTLTADLNSARAPWDLSNTTVTGTVTVPAGDSLRINSGSPTMTLVNEGRVILEGTPTLNGTLSTAVGSVLEVRSASGTTSATITNGFTNNGLLELRTANAFWGNQLTVGGTLVNSALGTIRAVAGFGGKALNAQLDNQGLIEVNEALTIARASAQHLNSGTIQLSGAANLQITQSGTTPSFAFGTEGAMDLQGSGGVVFSGGAVDLRLGSVIGVGSGVVSDNTTSFQLNPSTFEPRVTINGTFNSPSPITIAAGDSLRLERGIITAGGLTVDGTLILEGNLTMNTPTMTVNPGASVLVRSASFANASATFTHPLTVNGTLRLMSQNTTPAAVNFGTNALTIAAGGTLDFATGVAENHALSAASIDNNGTITFGSSAAVTGPIAQRNLMTVSALKTATLSSPLTLFTGSVTTNLGTLTLNGGCVLNGTPTLSGFVCP